MLARLGERIRLARLRRQLSSAAIAARAGISRTTLYKVELGDPGITLGTCLRVLAALGLDQDFDQLAADDHVGRRLQDLALDRAAASPRRRTSRRSGAHSPSSDEETP